jgi:YHS domain-containing protein
VSGAGEQRRFLFADLAGSTALTEAVDPERAAGSLIFDGTEYHSCSLDCAAKFAGAPARYAVPD